MSVVASTKILLLKVDTPTKVETPVALKSPVVVPPETNMPSLVVLNFSFPSWYKITDSSVLKSAIDAEPLFFVMNTPLPLVDRIVFPDP